MLTREKHRHRADITLHARGEKFLHGVGDVRRLGSRRSAQAVDKIAQQAQKVKGKWQERKRHGVKAGVVAEAGDSARRAAAPAGAPRARRVRMPPILQASRQAIKPMSVADAARQIDASDEGVVVFRDAETAVDQRAVSPARTAS